MLEATGIYKPMLDLGHIRQMLARYDAHWRHKQVD